MFPRNLSCPRCGTIQDRNCPPPLLRFACPRCGAPLEDGPLSPWLGPGRGSLLLISMIAICGTLGISRARPTAKPSGLPPAHSFDEASMPLREISCQL